MGLLRRLLYAMAAPSWATKSSGPIMCSPAPPWGYFWAHLQWSWFRWKALAQCVAWKDSILMPEMMILAIILLVSFWCVTVVIKYICSLCHKLLNVPDQNGSAVWPKDQRCRTRKEDTQTPQNFSITSRCLVTDLRETCYVYIDILLGIFTDVQRGSKANTTIIELVLKHEVRLFWKELAKEKNSWIIFWKFSGTSLWWHMYRQWMA